MKRNEIEQAIDLFTGLISAHQRNVIPNRNGRDRTEMVRLERVYRVILNELLKVGGISVLQDHSDLWDGGRLAMLREADTVIRCMQSFEKNEPVVPGRTSDSYLSSLQIADRVVLDAIHRLDG